MSKPNHLSEGDFGENTHGNTLQRTPERTMEDRRIRELLKRLADQP